MANSRRIIEDAKAEVSDMVFSLVPGSATLNVWIGAGVARTGSREPQQGGRQDTCAPGCGNSDRQHCRSYVTPSPLRLSSFS